MTIDTDNAADPAALIVDNHGHAGGFEEADIVEGYDPEMNLGRSHETYLSLMDAVGSTLRCSIPSVPGPTSTTGV